MSNPSQPHDQLFKHLFSEPKLVLSYLKGSLPRDWFVRLESQTLTRLPDSYVDDQLQEQISDVVYQCQLKDTKQWVNLVFLLEHKSYVPPFPHLQLLRYMVNLWQKQIVEGKFLHPIIPMVVYHGRQDWEMKPFGSYFSIQGENWLEQFLPNFSYHLTNLRQENPQQIEKQFEELVLRKAFLLMKWVFEKKLSDHVEAIFYELLSAPADQPESKYFRIFITYLTHSPNPGKNQIMAKVKSLTEEWNLPPGSVAYEWYQEIEQKGIEQGIEKGIEKGIEQGKEQGIEQERRVNIEKMLQKGFSPQQVSDILELPLELVQKVGRNLLME